MSASDYGKNRDRLIRRNRERSAAAASEAAPIYRKVEHLDSGATKLFFIVCDEGWRESIVCERMYEWTADWLLGVLGRREYAPGTSLGLTSAPSGERAGDAT
jgi:hypothetical protein